MEAQAVATQLMIELCGATRRAGDDRRRRPGPRARDDPPARRAGRGAARDRRSRASAAQEILEALEFEVGRRRRRPRRDGPRVPARRRHARGRRDRGGRPARRRSSSCRRRSPRATGRYGRLDATAAAAPPRRRRARRPGPARDRRLELHRPGAGRPAAAARRPPLRERSSSRTRCRRAVAAAHHAARLAARRRRPQPRARAPAAAAVRGGRGVTCPTPTAGSRASRTTSARSSPALCDPPTLARSRSAAGRLLRRQGRRRRACSTRLRRRAGASSAATEPFLHPGRAARDPRSAARPRAGSARSTRWSRPSGRSSGHVAAFELDLDAVAGAARPPLYEDVTSFPEVREDLAVVVSDDVSAARVIEVVRERRRAAAAQRRGVRRLPRPRAAGRGQRVAGAAAHATARPTGR